MEVETKEIKINVPEGYEIDRENSTFECIKFKQISNRWKDTVNELQEFTIGSFGGIKATGMKGTKGCDGHGIFATEKQAKSALAMAQISQIMANDERFGGVITDKEWEDGEIPKYCISREKTHLQLSTYQSSYEFLAFHTIEQRNLFYQENKQLVKDYLIIE